MGGSKVCVGKWSGGGATLQPPQLLSFAAAAAAAAGSGLTCTLTDGRLCWCWLLRKKAPSIRGPGMFCGGFVRGVSQLYGGGEVDVLAKRGEPASWNKAVRV